MTRCLLTSIGGHRVYFYDRVSGMPIYRAKDGEDRPVIIPYQYVEDDRISWGASGVLAVLCSFPRNLKITKSMILEKSSDKITRLNRYLAELIKFDYVTVSREKGVVLKPYIEPQDEGR